MAIYRVLANIVTDTDKEKIELGIARLESYKEKFLKFQNDYVLEGMNNLVVDLKLDLAEWKSIVEHMPYPSNGKGPISIKSIDDNKYIEMAGKSTVRIVKTPNNVFLIGEKRLGNGTYIADIDIEIILMIKHIIELNNKDIKNKRNFPNIHNFYEPTLNNLPRIKELDDIYFKNENI